MPKIERKGCGLKEYDTVRYEGAEVAAGIEAWADACDAAVGSQDRFADEMRRLLAQSGFPFGEKGASARVHRECPESSAEFLAHEWLLAYSRVRKCEAELASGKPDNYSLPTLIDAAEKMGKLREEMWWRCVHHGETGRSPEALALSGKQLRKPNNRRGIKSAKSLRIIELMTEFRRSGMTARGAAIHICKSEKLSREICELDPQRRRLTVDACLSVWNRR